MILIIVIGVVEDFTIIRCLHCLTNKVTLSMDMLE